jgi:hypothetical protein
MAGRHYSSDELEMIVALRQAGLSIPAVARQLGRTSSGIQGVLRTRGWVDPMRSRAMVAVEIFSPEQRQAFRDFVSPRAAIHTPTEIGDQWNKEAGAKSWPTANSERVIYYLRQMGLQKTRREYMQVESYRRKQRVAQKTRRAKERELRRQELRTYRGELYSRESDISRRKCQACGETWPLREEFFHTAGNTKYLLYTCRLCDHSLSGTAEERREHRALKYDRHVVLQQIAAAKVERDASLRQHRNLPTRRCARCREVWELLPRRYPRYKASSGRELYRKTCRFCLRLSERLKERARKAISGCPGIPAANENSAPAPAIIGERASTAQA